MYRLIMSAVVCAFPPVHPEMKTAALKIGQAIYGNKGADGGDAAGAGGGQEGTGADRENVQDAEFEEKTQEDDQKQKENKSQ